MSDDEYGQIRRKIGETENETLNSTRNALRLLNQTTETSYKTAEVSLKTF